MTMLEDAIKAAHAAGYAEGLRDGARQTRETIARVCAEQAKAWMERQPYDVGRIVATTLDGFAEAVRSARGSEPAEDEIEQLRRGA